MQERVVREIFPLRSTWREFKMWRAGLRIAAKVLKEPPEPNACATALYSTH